MSREVVAVPCEADEPAAKERFEAARPWPDPRPLAECRPRHRICTEGVVAEVVRPAGPPIVFRAELVEGEHRLSLVFLGRDEVPGFAVGRRVRCEGMVGAAGALLRMLNPAYCFVADEPSPSATS